MPIQAPKAQEAPGHPFLPTGTRPLGFEQFRGLNTQTTRPGVPDEQAYWLDGFMPLAERNLRTLYGIGTAIYTAAGTTVVCFYFANLGSTPYCIIFLANGQVVAVNTNTLVATTILAAATITSPSVLNVGVSQWGRDYIILVADQPNGYWLWDGANVFTAGTLSPLVPITNVGGGYVNTPTIGFFGGHGSGASAVATLLNGQVTSISVVNPGTGYLANDLVSVAFIGAPAGGTGATLTPFGIQPSGPPGYFGFTGLSVVSGGSNYSNNPTVVITINPALVALQPTGIVGVTGGVITSATVTNGGLFIGSLTPTISIADAGVAAEATAGAMQFGVQGHAVETYQGHVWVADDATIYYSAPGSFVDFSTNNGGGNFTSTDSFLQVKYIGLVQSNGFLYLIGDSSTNYISGVQTTGTPPTTTFTNQNADPEVGTPYPASIATFGRNVMFANAWGIHVVAGSAANKASADLDGVYNSVSKPSNNFDFGMQLSSAKAIIFGRKVWMTLARIIDPITGTTENKLLMWDGKCWWTSLQDINLTYIKHQEINSIITAYGTNGTVVHPLFSTPSTAFTKRAQSRLFDAPGGIMEVKAESNIWLMSQFYSTLAPSIMLSIDNENGTMALPYTITGPASTGITVAPPQAIGQQGVLSGVTIHTTAGDMALIEVLLQAEPVAYRGR